MILRILSDARVSNLMLALFATNHDTGEPHGRDLDAGDAIVRMPGSSDLG